MCADGSGFECEAESDGCGVFVALLDALRARTGVLIDMGKSIRCLMRLELTISDVVLADDFLLVFRKSEKVPVSVYADPNLQDPS